MLPLRLLHPDGRCLLGEAWQRWFAPHTNPVDRAHTPVLPHLLRWPAMMVSGLIRLPSRAASFDTTAVLCLGPKK